MAKKEFNKAEALRRYRAGEKVTAIAEAMGATKTEVYNAIRELKRAEEWGAVKASDSGAAESEAVAPADSVSGADNTEIPTEKEKPPVGVPVGDTNAEKPAPKKRGRKKKTAEPDVVVAENETPTEDGQEIPEDIVEFADSPEEWAERKCEENSSSETYFVKLKDGTELIINGVTKVLDGWNKIIFAGNTGKAVVVSAAELVYYLPKDSEDVFGEFSVERKNRRVSNAVHKAIY